MRSGLSIIQQTLTAEAANILNQSIGEACRRTHAQTTPLHVAATLLSSPSGFLRQACIRSHPNSSHPLQCRALELCFSVALERLPTAQNTAPGMEPLISNALMAALKRAQAHQRRGSPEQQQQPLLAVKVELDHLIISILDDPSVSRVMREASFSSPAVKAAIEQFSNTSNSKQQQHHGMISNSVQSMQSPNLYLNPRFHRGKIGDNRGNDVKKLIEIMSRSRKRNPILVGDTDPKPVVKELLQKIVSGIDAVLNNVTVISMDKNHIGGNMKELGELIENIVVNGGVIVDLGDLKWLVEQHQQQQSEMVVQISNLLARFREDNKENKVWLIGTASCKTYLRCQVYHSTMETDWDIQAVPMASKSLVPPDLPRLWSNSVEQFTTVKPKSVSSPLLAITENFDPVERAPFCTQCWENFEKEATKLAAIQKSFSEASLPHWLQNAKLNTVDAKTQDHSQELLKKWKDVCLHLHPHYHQNHHPATPPLPMLLHRPNLPIFPSRLQMMKPLGEFLRLNTDQSTISPPRSPVRTDLILGRISPERIVEEARAKDSIDVDMYKKLMKGFMEKAWWQGEAASAVASSITRCRSGNRKRRGDVWLLFTGPDRVAKKKMAMVISEHLCGASPVIISLGGRREDDEFEMRVRGKTTVDLIAEAVGRNPFSVIMLQDIDEANDVVLEKIKRAIERGRIDDSHGRDVGLGNAVFIVTGNWLMISDDEDRRFSQGNGNWTNWQLRLVVKEKSSKRRRICLDDDDYRLTLDLNLGRREDDHTDGSYNSSEVTVDHDDLFGHQELPQITNNNPGIATCRRVLTMVNDSQNMECESKPRSMVTPVPRDLVDNVDESIVFKQVDSVLMKREIEKTMLLKFEKVMGDNVSLEVGDDVLEKILGGLWHDQTSLGEWIEKVLEPSFDQLKPRVSSSSLVVLLAVEVDSGGYGKRSNRPGDWLPCLVES